MQEPFFIKKVAVLGAGVMGAQIAAHCINAGIETLLFDLSAKEGKPNTLVDKAIAHLKTLKPSPLGVIQDAAFIQAKNYDENLEELSNCDLIIEAIGEKIEWKEALYQRISPHLSAHSILVSNTSGLSINALNEVLPEKHRAQFCGVHFFNPPRYMHLAELIPAKETSRLLLDNLETWLTSYLGKGVIRAKDTPNFIANRIGVFSLLVTLHHTVSMNMDLDEVDALTGALLGRPKSATFRTMDVVGLDTLQHVVSTMEQHLKEDPWHVYFKLPLWLETLIKQGHLGQKTGGGIYKKKGSAIEVYDYHSLTWRPSKAKLSEEVQQIMKIENPEQKMKKLIASQDKQAQFLVACFRDLFHYCAYHLENIAENVRDVDLAMCWGFGWNQGLFATWQDSGFQAMTLFIEESIRRDQTLSKAPLPKWLNNLSAFYVEQGAYSPATNSYQPLSKLPVYQKQLAKEKKAASTIYENEGIRLWHLGDEIGVISLKSKANSIGQAVLDGLNEALSQAEKECKGLIVYQDNASNFCSGADLRAVSHLIQQNKMHDLELMITQFQQVVMRMKYSLLPVVAALRGRALGGGCELLLHCDRIVAAFESYPGLVEFGVGLIPGGGGCKEMALRAANQAQQADLMLFLQPFFQNIATAKVASSAPEARDMGYLTEKSVIMMHAEEVLYGARSQINALIEANYLPALRKKFKIAGIEGHARLQVGLVNWLEGGFISEHDYFIANELAQILCGGNLNQNTLVDEDWILALERTAFMKLASMPLSQARIQYLLETGKALRN